MDFEINAKNELTAIVTCLGIATGLIIKKIKEYEKEKNENIVADVEGKIIEEDI